MANIGKGKATISADQPKDRDKDKPLALPTKTNKVAVYDQEEILQSSLYIVDSNKGSKRDQAGPEVEEMRLELEAIKKKI